MVTFIDRVQANFGAITSILDVIDAEGDRTYTDACFPLQGLRNMLVTTERRDEIAYLTIITVIAENNGFMIIEKYQVFI
jgi:hypothetical protein